MELMHYVDEINVSHGGAFLAEDRYVPSKSVSTTQSGKC